MQLMDKCNICLLIIVVGFSMAGAVFPSWEKVVIVAILALVFGYMTHLARNVRDDVEPLRQEVRDLDDRISVIEAREAFK
jgi:hypothetical protein